MTAFSPLLKILPKIFKNSNLIILMILFTFVCQFQLSWIPIRINIYNMNPDPGNPNQCGSKWIWIRIRNAAFQVTSKWFLMQEEAAEIFRGLEALIYPLYEAQHIFYYGRLPI